MIAHPITTRPVTPRIVHVAAEDASVRETLRQVLAEHAGMDAVIVLSREGAHGFAAVADTQPQVVVLATRPGAGACEDTVWYKHALPKARLIAFAFSDEQERQYWEAGADAVARSREGRAGLVRLLQAD